MSIQDKIAEALGEPVAKYFNAFVTADGIIINPVKDQASTFYVEFESIHLPRYYSESAELDTLLEAVTSIREQRIQDVLDPENNPSIYSTAIPARNKIANWN